jgi:hypothetical protein|tara:strand:- start:2091 stop:2747 length:657 start_codon:yes stop_codon:yes gene_type:complete
LTSKQFSRIYLATLAGLVLLFLGVTGRLHPLFAVLGALLPFVARIIPLLTRGMQAFGLFQQFRNLTGAQSSTGPDQSEIKTRFLHVTLVHDSGMMDGKVLEGSMGGSMLANLNLQQLLVLLDECRVDADSLNVLQAYLDREHKGWRGSDNGGGTSSSDSGGELTKEQAYEVLGLMDGASKEEIVDAHRKLMQRMHPDRGGSTYLAARINEARKRLLGK